MITATAVLALAVALGADTSGGVPGLVLLVVLAVAFAVAWNGIFYLTALTSRTHAAVLGLQPLFMPVVMFSTFWVPTQFMPGCYRAIATGNPFNPVLTAGRAALLGTGAGGDLALGCAVLTVLAGLTYTLAVRRYTRPAGAD